MNTLRISSDFSPNKYKDAKLGFKVSHILSKLANNPGFPNPSPGLLTIETANNKYMSALSRQKMGGRQNTLIKKQCREKLQLLMRQLAVYVQTTSGGDPVLIAGSGFSIHKKRSLVGHLTQPEFFAVKQGPNNGSVEVRCKAIKGARFYEFIYNEVSLAEKGVWLKKTSTKRKILIEGLVSGGRYSFCVAGAGSEPSRIWSEKLTIYIQ